MVGHQVDDEVVRSRHNDNAGEGSVEVVRVVVDGQVLVVAELIAEIVEGVEVCKVVEI